MGSTAATLLLTLVVSRISVPGSIAVSRVTAGRWQRFGEQALHLQAVPLNGRDVRGAADQRDVVVPG